MSLLQPRIDLAKQRIPKAENAGVPKWTQLRVQCRNSINNLAFLTGIDLKDLPDGPPSGGSLTDC